MKASMLTLRSNFFPFTCHTGILESWFVQWGRWDLKNSDKCYKWCITNTCTSVKNRSKMTYPVNGACCARVPLESNEFCLLGLRPGAIQLFPCTFWNGLHSLGKFAEDWNMPSKVIAQHRLVTKTHTHPHAQVCISWIRKIWSFLRSEKAQFFYWMSARGLVVDFHRASHCFLFGW